MDSETTLQEIANSIKRARIDYPNRVLVASKSAIEFSFAVGAALGEISVDEANEAVIKVFKEKLKNG